MLCRMLLPVRKFRGRRFGRTCRLIEVAHGPAGGGDEAVIPIVHPLEVVGAAVVVKVTEGTLLEARLVVEFALGVDGRGISPRRSR